MMLKKVGEAVKLGDAEWVSRVDFVRNDVLTPRRVHSALERATESLTNLFLTGVEVASKATSRTGTLEKEVCWLAKQGESGSFH